MNIKPKVNGTKVVTGKIRLSYANVFEPGLQEGQARYSVSIIIPKSDTETIAAINKAVEEAKEQG